MQYDIEADWTLLNTCNYRCAYCFVPPATLGEKLTVYAEPEVWRQAIDRTGLTWLLHITGGEPTIYPRFAELCQLLTANHYLSFNSNLTHSSVVDFAKRVDPSRISFINAGLHAEERERRKGLAKFLRHAACLKERNFPIFVSIVSTDDVLSRVDEIVALTAPIGLTPIPKLLKGSYNGKIYPEAYTAKEKATFIEFATRARESYSPLLDDFSEHISINVSGDKNYVDGIPEFSDRMCSAGEKFANLRPDGKVYRCEVKLSNYLGNILDGSFRPRTGKSRCDSNYCFYFCLKYSDGPTPTTIRTWPAGPTGQSHGLLHRATPDVLALPDQKWVEVASFLRREGREEDVEAAPEEFRCLCHGIRCEFLPKDALRTLQPEAIVVLHKGRLVHQPQAALAALLSATPIFANDVFVLFSRTGASIPAEAQVHIDPIKHAIASHN